MLCNGVTFAAVPVYTAYILCVLFGSLPPTPEEHGTELQLEVRDIDREAWATTTTLRLSALFRHYSQSCLRCRGWVPKAWVLCIETALYPTFV